MGEKHPWKLSLNLEERLELVGIISQFSRQYRAVCKNDLEEQIVLILQFFVYYV